MSHQPQRLTAIVTFEGCLQSAFGYPNDEATWGDPRGAAGDEPGYGFFEILDSTWLGRLIAYNNHAFPDRTPSHWSTLRLQRAIGPVGGWADG
jgi:hypothetical protein